MADPGRDSYRGFEYQVHVSAWLAVVFLSDGERDAVVIEPLGGEDLAALDPASSVDTRERAVACQAGDVLVQVKTRAAGAWGNEHLSAILTGKDPTTKATTRVRPLATLKATPTARFLFVTEASVNADLGPLKVDTPLFAARQVPQGKLTATLKGETDELRGRIAILPGQLPAAVYREACDVLVHKWRVPRLNVRDCHARLVERIREGLRSAARGTLSATEIQQLVRDFGGEPEGPQPFVEPGFFDGFRSILEHRHALLLQGEPGVGKTTAAHRLIYEHRTRREPFALIEVAEPAALERWAREVEPILVYVDDPFGRDHHEESTGKTWARALDRFLAHTTSSRRLIVTSRESFAAPHVSEERTPRLHAARRRMSSEGYDREALLEGLMNREPGLDTAGRAWIGTRREPILATLARPISFERLVARAAHVPPEERTANRLIKIIEDAKNADFGPELEETFRDRPDAEVRGLVVLWLGLHVWRHSDSIAPALTGIEAALGDAEIHVVVNKMKQYSWLRSTGQRLTMHPSYESACLQVAEGRQALARRTVERVVNVLLNQHAYREAWRAWRAVIRTSLAMSGAIIGRLAVAARAVLLEPTTTSATFLATLRFLAAAPVRENVLDRVVAALASRNGGADSWSTFGGWKPPAWNAEQWREAISSLDVVCVVRRFVREGLPTTPPRMPSVDARQLVDFLYRLVDLSAEFDGLVAAIEARQETALPIAMGAVRSRTANIEAIVAKAMAIDASVDSWWRNIADEGDYDDEEYWEHFSAEWYQRHEPADALIDAVLDERALSGMRDWAAQRQERLVFERFAERARREELELRVIERVLAACPADVRVEIATNVAQRANGRRWDAVHLLNRVPAPGWPPILRHLFYEESERDLPTRADEAVSIVASAATRLPPSDRVALIHDLRNGATSRIAEAILSATATREQHALRALQIRGHAIHCEALSIVEAIAASEHTAAIDAMEALRNVGLRVVEQATAHFRKSTQASPKRSYLTIIGSLIDDRIEGDIARAVAIEALSAPQAVVRAEAVAILARVDAGAELEAIAALAKDRAASVRIAVAEAMVGRCEHIAGAVLTKLLADGENTSEAARHGWSEECEIEFGVARAAARALAQMKPWGGALADAISDFLASKAPTAQDAAIRQLLAGVEHFA